MSSSVHCCPAHIHQVGAGSRLRGFNHWFLDLHLPVLLAGPGPSGSADPSRRCRGCSHPTLRLQGQAAPSFSGLLRQAAGGLLPPARSYGASWRTVASKIDVGELDVIEAAGAELADGFVEPGTDP